MKEYAVVWMCNAMHTRSEGIAFRAVPVPHALWVGAECPGSPSLGYASPTTARYLCTRTAEEIPTCCASNNALFRPRLP